METKPAIYCTEFWFHILLQLIFTLNTVHIWIYMSPRWSGIVQSIIAAAYMVSRGIAKSKGGFDPGIRANSKLFPRRADLTKRN